MSCCCTIIPAAVLARLAEDASLSDGERKGLADTIALDAKLRRVRVANAEINRIAGKVNGLAGLVQLAAAPGIEVYDCQTTMSLPGTRLTNPSQSADATAVRAFNETTQVAAFFSQAFGRSSIDNQGMTLLSSIHYGSGYNNAFWNGAQMTYGDGNGSLFVDFTLSTDVIAHELTHGVTERTSAFVYTNEAGGLNESMSDVFGSMFRQWRKNQTVAQADWLIGKEILGPAALAAGYTCLRSMKDPGGAHCLSTQPSHYRDYRPGMDPHDSSGIANYAFYLAATAVGGQSWVKVGKIWYAALTNYGRTPNATFAKFADRCRQSASSLFPGDSAVYNAVDTAWTTVLT